MMNNRLVVEQKFVCKSEFRRINLCKYHLLDKLNSSNTQHSIVIYISSIFNKCNNHLNSTNIKPEKFPKEIRVQYFDILTVEQAFSDFIKELYSIKTPQFVVDYFNNIITSILQILELKVIRY